MDKNKKARIEIRLTTEEKEQIIKDAGGTQKVSSYIRRKLLGKGSQLINPVDLIKHADQVTYQINKIGNNINQLAKYANQRKETDDQILQNFNKHLNEYVKQQKELEKVYRKIIAL